MSLSLRTRCRRRTGATTVLVAILTLVLASVVAFAIDISRLHMGVNELQTAADAAALRGAAHLQTRPTNAARTPDSVLQFAVKNAALGQTPLTSADVRPMLWDPATSTATNAAWNTANAVEVTTRLPAGLLFGRVFNRSNIPMSRRAVSWVANVTGVDCIRPWGIASTVLQTKLGLTFNPVSQATISAVRDSVRTASGRAWLTVTMAPDVNQTSGVTPTDGFYNAITGTSNSGVPAHVAMITGTQCGNGVAELPVGTVAQQPGNGNNVAKEAGNIVAAGGPCKKGTTANDATCYDPAQPGFVAGPSIVVPLTVPVSTNSVRITSLAVFRMMCAFTVDPPGNPMGPSPERCPHLTSIGRPATGYRRGTIVGYLEAGFVDLGGGAVLGNTPSLGQRLILVR